MGPVIGALAAAAFKGIFDILNVNAQNKYNSPLGQLKRLRKAGLPLAYMYQGKINQQSTSPTLSIDPDLGVTEQKQLGNQTRLTDEQINKLKAETENLGFDKDLKWYERERERAKFNWNQETDLLEKGKGVLQYRTKQEQEFDANLGIKKADQFIAENTGELKSIAVNIAKATQQTDINIRKQEYQKIRKQIVQLIAQSKILGQLYNIRELEETVNKSFSDNLENQEDWQVNLYKMFMTLFGNIKL